LPTWYYDCFSCESYSNEDKRADDNMRYFLSGGGGGGGREGEGMNILVGLGGGGGGGDPSCL